MVGGMVERVVSRIYLVDIELLCSLCNLHVAEQRLVPPANGQLRVSECCQFESETYVLDWLIYRL